jgi:hypothetical protein
MGGGFGGLLERLYLTFNFAERFSNVPSRCFKALNAFFLGSQVVVLLGEGNSI